MSGAWVLRLLPSVEDVPPSYLHALMSITEQDDTYTVADRAHALVFSSIKDAGETGDHLLVRFGVAAKPEPAEQSVEGPWLVALGRDGVPPLYLIAWRGTDHSPVHGFDLGLPRDATAFDDRDLARANAETLTMWLGVDARVVALDEAIACEVRDDTGSDAADTANTDAAVDALRRTGARMRAGGGWEMCS